MATYFSSLRAEEQETKRIVDTVIDKHDSQQKEINSKTFILNQPKELKLELLQQTLDLDRFDMFLALAKILLDAPITEGGISTEEIEEIRFKHYDDDQAWAEAEHQANVYYHDTGD